MAGYSPLKITGFQTGLVQEREEFLLPDDAYPILQNAYVWRERLLRKKGYELLGRLQRSVSISTVLVANSVNLLTGLQATSSVVPGTINLVGGTDGTTYTDTLMNGTLTATGGTGTGGSINYATGVLIINAGGVETITGTIQYYPNLPVMGIRTRETQSAINDQTIFFDQVYAYVYNQASVQFQEFITGTTWNAHSGTVAANDFFWSTNWWVSANPPFSTSNKKLFWVTNNTGQYGNLMDPIRITDGTTWVNFNSGTWNKIDNTTYLVNALSFLPYRGRLVMFNTWEGPNNDGSGGINYTNRIRWSTIGNPFIAFHNTTGPNDPNKGSWRDDVRGQGGFLDIPTSEDIISVGFVRDNVVIYCERSTWQLRYTGRSIAPFQIERVNSEIGGEGPFSSIQFDDSLVSIGDKGIIKCDSYIAKTIDVKIPDYVFQIQNPNNGPSRVQGARDFINRLAYWTLPIASNYSPRITESNQIFPNTRLVYNYENDSWATYTDSLTALGTYQPQSGRNWLNTKAPWIKCKFSWIGSQSNEIPKILGGNQQGFIEFLDEFTANDPSLYISNIVGHTTTPTVITSPHHNMVSGFVIGISGIPATTPYSNLNDGIFGITVIDQNSFSLRKYDPTTGDFTDPQLDVPPADPYLGGGLINIRENFSIVSKKFNFLDEGQNIQLGYLDILMSATGAGNPGAISLNVYLDYNDNEASNTIPQNVINGGNNDTPDAFFNAVIPTTESTLNGKGGSKFWQRVYCPTRANFLTLQYTFSNAQMAGIEQQLDVQIDAQVLWIRKAGRLTQS